MKGFIGLQSEYSLLNSTIRLGTLFKTLEERNFDTVFLSDDNNLYGSYKFFSAKTHLRRIIGMKLSIIHLEQKTSLYAYAISQTGYQNLIILSSLIQLSKTKVVEMTDLIKYQTDLVFITTGYDSDIDQALLENNYGEAKKRIESYVYLLKHFYLGLMVQTLKMEIEVAPKLQALSLEYTIDMLPIHQANYEGDVAPYDALIQIEQSERRRFDEGDFSLPTYEKLIQSFSEYKVVFNNLNRVFEHVNFSPEKLNFELPNPLEPGISSKVYLKDLCEVGLGLRHKKQPFKNPERYLERLNYELSVIDKMGYNNYFLVVWDFVKYAKKEGILVGPGRGSAAGSLVSFALGITDVDPLKYDLLFERFLNPERISMPDIDLDFPDNKRDDVIRYVQSKYGKHHVVSITTFGTFQVKSSIRDICRTQGLSVAETNRIVKQATEAYDIRDPNTLNILKLAQSIEGLPRHTGTHAAGIILSSVDLTRIIPLQTGSSELYQSQLEASDLEHMGLLKIDFLGIRNLQIIKETLGILEQRQIKLDLHNLPLDDVKTYELLSKADTVGVFQLESIGMKRVLTKLKPNQFEDLVAILALFRPGPMDNIDIYIERRVGKPFEYIDESLKDILAPTYGIIIYQEQIMKIASEFANYTLAEADLLRRGVSKKDKEILESERLKFIRKAVENNKPEALAIKIYDYILKFALYGFNRSHSVAYALVAYQMAYLKAHYFDAFMTVLLSSIASNTEQVMDYIQQLKARGIKVLKPNIQTSDFEFTLTPSGIVYPLIAIKNVGTQAVTKVKEARLNGPFIDYDDFKKRLSSELNDKVIEALIFAGALDGFGLNKKTLYENRKLIHKDYELFVSDIEMKQYDEYSLDELVEKEKMALGFNLSYTPASFYQPLLEKYHLKTLDQIEQTERVLGLIKRVKVIQTKTGKSMAFLEVSDGQTTIDVTVFPEIYSKYNPLMNSKDPLILTIEPNQYDGKKYILNRIEVIKDEHAETQLK
ncbi:DNA polymerase III subunit alpha [Acholeplasma vituli]|uniref:DNA-directed DNA polymerase n=1 Tax=Paracholeplasma vituli TaxID=69473 RepID=A0ABT2PTV2_9MOLU|nr:DNA polymerase III subunit alpha [Paracholeplasma vituli]MCU0104380.1 DNA polymerase III subunit alpha [Paracholeplasma vituli]